MATKIQTNNEEAKPKDAANNKQKDNKSYLKLAQLPLLPPSVISHYSPFRNTKISLMKKLVVNSTFEVDDRYEIIDAIGQGAYGIVVAAKDKSANKKERQYVAIKKIEKAFEHKIFTKRTLRELKILRLLRHENVIGIRTLLLPRSREEFEDIYVCSPLMETDLSSIIKSPQSLTDEHVQFFIYQVLRGLKYVHSAGIIHRDLKPRNLLVNSNCDLKICDFGLSRATHCKDEPGKMTDYVATRWYRAPELLLEVKEYGPSVDVWSVGCILAELLRRKPFLPGSDTRNQLDITFEAFGTPNEELITAIPKPRLRKFLRSLPPKKPRQLEAFFPKANPLAVDLLKKMMVLDYRKRITVDEALKHPYLKDLHYPEDEPIRELVPTIEFEFEKYPLSLQQMKDLVYEEILLYHFEDFRKEYFRKVQAGENPFMDVINNGNAVKTDQYERGYDEEF
jgi:serine/threonine protein kinase